MNAVCRAWSRVVFALALIGVAYGQIEWKVEPLTGTEAVPTRLPVRIQAYNKGASLRGAVDLRIDESLSFWLPLELPQGARKEVVIPIPYDLWNPQAFEKAQDPAVALPRVFWRVEGERAKELRASFPQPSTLSNAVPESISHRNLPLLVVGDAVGGLERWRTPRSLYATVETERRRARTVTVSYAWTPVYLRPEQLPDDPNALLGVPVVMLTEGAERLREAQWDALAYWMLCGGQLIVAVGSMTALPANTPIAALAPRFQERFTIRLSEPIRSPVGLEIPAPRRSIVLTRVASTKGWSVYASGAQPIALQTQVGDGMLLFFLGDLFALAWREGVGTEPLVHQWLRPESPALRLTARAPAIPPAPWFSASQALTATALLGAYWFWLYTLRHILRQRDLLRQAPRYIALMTVALALLAFALSPKPVPEPPSETVAKIRDGRLPHSVELRRYRRVIQGGTRRLELPETEALFQTRTESALPVRTVLYHKTPPEIEFQAEAHMQAELQTLRYFKEVKQ